MTVEVLVQTALNGAVLGTEYSLLALGLTLLFSIMNILFFAHGAMYMIAAFIMYYLTVRAGFHYLLASVITLLIIPILGAIVEKGIIRQVRDKVLGIFFVTVGLQWFLESAGYVVFGIKPKAVPSYLVGSIVVSGVMLPWERLAVIIGGLAAVVGLHLFLTRTKQGLAMRCYVEDAEVAELQGIKGHHVSRLAFMIACGLAALAGVLVAPLFYVDANMGTPAVFRGFLVVGVAGLGSIPGALIAGMILGFIDSFGSTFIGPQVTWGLVFLLVIVFLTIRPRGIMGIVR